MKKLLYHYLYPVGLYFTAIVLLFTLALVAAGGSSTLAPTPSAIGSFFLLSLLLAAAGRIFTVSALSLLARTLLHYLAAMASCIFVVLLFQPNLSSGAGALLLAAVLTLVYAIIATITLLIVCRKRKRSNETQNYKRQF